MPPAALKIHRPTAHAAHGHVPVNTPATDRAVSDRATAPARADGPSGFSSRDLVIVDAARRDVVRLLSELGLPANSAVVTAASERLAHDAVRLTRRVCKDGAPRPLRAFAAAARERAVRNALIELPEWLHLSAGGPGAIGKPAATVAAGLHAGRTSAVPREQPVKMVPQSLDGGVGRLARTVLRRVCRI